jgi:flagellar basal body-associated protein FliL
MFKEKIFLRRLIDYFFKNPIKAISSLGTLLGMAIFSAYYIPLQYLPHLHLKSLPYILTIIAFSGLFMLCAFFFLLFSICISSRLILPIYLPNNFEERIRLIVARITIPHILIISLIISIINYKLVNNSCLIILIALLFSAALAGLLLFILNVQKSKNKGSDFWGFFGNYTFAVFFYIIFAVIGESSLNSTYSTLSRILSEINFVAFFVCMNIFLTASFKKTPRFLLKLKIARKDEITDPLVTVDSHPDKKTLLWTSLIIFIALTIMLTFPSANGNFFAKNIAQKCGIYAKNKEILIDEKGCEIAKAANVTNIQTISPTLCKISHIDILSNLGEEYLLAFTNEQKIHRFKILSSSIKTTLDILDLNQG